MIRIGYSNGISWLRRKAAARPTWGRVMRLAGGAALIFALLVVSLGVVRGDTTSQDAAVQYLPDLARFPEPFVSQGAGSAQSFTIHFVLPSDPTDAELRVAALMAARMGQAATGEGLNFTVQHQLPDHEPAVVIGRASALADLLGASAADRMVLKLAPDRRHFLDLDGSLLAEDLGVVQYLTDATTQGSSAPVLVVSGGNDEGLVRAGLSLTAQVSPPFLSGNYAVAWQRPALPSIQTMAEMTTLQDLTGLGDQKAEGVGVAYRDYGFLIPPEWQVQSGAYIDVVFAHSSLLQDGRSSLTVMLNGEPIDTVTLDATNVQRTVRRVELPAQAFVPGYNYLRFELTLRAEGGEDAAGNGDGLWAVVLKESSLFLPHNEDGTYQPNLEQWPYPFILGNLEQTAIVLPEHPSASELLALLRVSSRLGQGAISQVLGLDVGCGEAMLQRVGAARHLIVIGRPANAAAEGSSWTRLRAYYEAADRSGGEWGALESLRSPWNPQRAVLLLFGTGDGALDWASHAVGMNPAGHRLRGTGLMFTAGGIVRALPTAGGDAGAQASPEHQTQAGAATKGASLLPFALILGVVLLALLLIVLIAHWRTRRVRKL